jgi:hypothetical protein
VLAALEEQGLGDAESRRLFAAALEYDLAGSAAIAEPGAEPEPLPGAKPGGTPDTLAEMGRAARTLAERLAGLEAAAAQRLGRGLQEADPFRRGYPDHYFCSLQRELERIAAVALAAEDPQPQAPAKPSVSEEARRFVLGVADAFLDCFELSPTAGPDAPFPAVIEAIRGVTGVHIPADPDTLADILRQG